MRNRWASLSSRIAALGTLLLLFGAAIECRAQQSLDALGERLTFSSAGGEMWARLSSTQDLTVYVPEADPPDTHAPGLLFSDDSVFVAPRLSVSLDAGIGERLLAHAQLRADRGFDPGSDEDGEVRFDEYFLEGRFLDGRVQIRAGKFATAFGGWVNRHLAWDNPLITAPAIYEDILTIGDQATPASLDELAARLDSPENKPGWVPMVWGPSYASGAALSLAGGPLDVTVEVKNAALSSRPRFWDVGKRDFGDGPTVTGRVGWHPAPAWTLGTSFSHGPYLQKDARATLPASADIDDFGQTMIGLDLTYERHRLQIWGELVRAEFELPRIGDVAAVGGFVEIRYKTAPRIWIAGRWNQTWFDDIPGLDRSWDRDLRRLDLGLGYRHNAHFQGKLEVSVGDRTGRDTVGNQLVAAQLVLWF
jgi:hypothetical protein